MLNFFSRVCCVSKTNSESKNISINTIEEKKFDLEGIEGKFYVDSVYDGDTITLMIGTKIHIFETIGVNQVNLDSDSNKSNTIYFNKVRVRLMGIDTPELRPKKNIPNRNEHIEKAKLAKEFLSNLVLNKSIKVKFLHNDLYGRPLVYLYLDNVCINDLMIENGYAKKYNGGTKDDNF